MPVGLDKLFPTAHQKSHQPKKHCRKGLAYCQRSNISDNSPESLSFNTFVIEGFSQAL
jgi:hypothetical protein